MPDLCPFCKKLVENDIKELLMFDYKGDVVPRLCHLSCYERLMSLKRQSHSKYMEGK